MYARFAVMFMILPMETLITALIPEHHLTVFLTTGPVLFAVRQRTSLKRKNKDENMGDCLDLDKELSILKSAIENTNEAFVTIDENHRVLFFNRAAEKVFGYSRDEVIGHDLDVIMSPGCSQDHRHAVEVYTKNRAPGPIGHGTEILATRKNGEAFPAHISFSVSSVRGKLYFTGIVRDLTETKALQNRILKSQRLSTLGQFVAEITHEIKNPLMMIGGFSHQLIHKTEDPQSLKKLHIMVNEVTRLEGLLKEVGEFYHSKPLSLDKLDMNALLRNVYLLFKDDCGEKKIRIGYHPAGRPLFVMGDKAKLEQVFLNLVKNSIESIKGGGELVIRSRLKENQAVVTVTDNGCGIPAADREKIFSPFYTTKSEGSGLGLSISKRIIEDHEGSIFTLKSEEGRGTEFKITMPLLPE